MAFPMSTSGPGCGSSWGGSVKNPKRWPPTGGKYVVNGGRAPSSGNRGVSSPFHSTWNDDVADRSVITGSTSSSEANTALPFASCPVTTRRTARAMATVYTGARGGKRGMNGHGQIEAGTALRRADRGGDGGVVRHRPAHRIGPGGARRGHRRDRPPGRAPRDLAGRAAAELAGELDANLRRRRHGRVRCGPRRGGGRARPDRHPREQRGDQRADLGRGRVHRCVP